MGWMCERSDSKERGIVIPYFLLSSKTLGIADLLLVCLSVCSIYSIVSVCTYIFLMRFSILVLIIVLLILILILLVHTSIVFTFSAGLCLFLCCYLYMRALRAGFDF